MKKFSFSIIMSVYNVEDYIQEAIESVIKQKIGFEKNIELILVDDGSTDGSSLICEKYKAMYPENIIVVHKTNKGPSSSKNVGLKISTGKYVNFMDPDDLISLNTCEVVEEVFRKNDETIDLVAIPIIMFGNVKGPHPTNKGKFDKKTKVIDLKDNYSSIQTSVASCFIRGDVAKKYNFSEDIKSMEDALFIFDVLIEKQKYCTTNKCKYYYRKRNNSLSSNSLDREDWYISHLDNFSLKCLEKYKDTNGNVPKFIQYTIMYDLGWKIKQRNLPPFFDSNMKNKYYRKIKKILSLIDDDIIESQKNIFSEHKNYCYMFKYNTNSVNRNRLIKNSVTINKIVIENESISIEGTILDFNEKVVFLKYNDKLLNINTIHSEWKNICGRKGYKYRRFNVSLDIDSNKVNTFEFVDNDYNYIKIKNNRFSLLSDAYSNYCTKCHDYFVGKKNHLIFITKNKLFGFKQYSAFISELLFSKSLSDKKAVAAIFLTSLLRKINRKRIWLICDKADKADDNGEVLFEYINSNKHTSIDAFFVINKKSIDYKRIKLKGKVVNTFSWKHKLLFLLAEKSISAYGHIESYNPFRGQVEPYKGYVNNVELVFLQHGVTQNDVSAGLNKYNKNYKRIVTLSKKEQSFFRRKKFFYDDDSIALTGFARFDKLYNNRKKIITFAPTWRRWLFNGFNPELSRWTLNEDFNNTEYYKKITSLLNNKRLIEASRKYGYSIKFMPHSIFFPYIDKFKVDDSVEIYDYNKKYRDMFAETSLLITDYSSVAFDFAYLGKPILYYQFDYDDFFNKGDYKKGYFDYDKDGFGKVLTKEKEIVNEIIRIMKNECNNDQLYVKREKNFFEYRDRNNCERIFRMLDSIPRKNI